jgi:hypothetical protein
MTALTTASSNSSARSRGDTCGWSLVPHTHIFYGVTSLSIVIPSSYYPGKKYLSYIKSIYRSGSSDTGTTYHIVRSPVICGQRLQDRLITIYGIYQMKSTVFLGSTSCRSEEYIITQGSNSEPKPTETGAKLFSHRAHLVA